MRKSILLAFLVASALPLRAGVFAVPPDAELVDRAAAVVVATVNSTATTRDTSGMIVTDLTVSVQRVLKGPISTSEPLVIREPGGVIGDEAFFVSGVPKFEVGERALLFLDQRSDGLYTTWGMAVGKFSFFGSRRSPLVVRTMHRDVLLLKELDGSPHEERPRNAFRFYRYIDAIVAGDHPDVDYYAVDSALPIGGPDPEEATHAAGARVITPLNHVPASAYTSNKFRWDRFDKGGSVTFYVNGRQPGYDDLGAAQRALAAWTNEPNSNIDYRYGGTGGGGFVEDGLNSIVYNATSGVPAGAIAYSQMHAGAQHTYKGETFYTMTETDVIVKSGLTVSQATFDEAVTHELGHTLGFRHSNEGTPATSDAVMNAVVSGRWGANLSPWDRDAVSHMYGNGVSGGTTPPAASGVRGDFNGDRFVDIVLRNTSTGQNALWLMQGVNFTSVADLPALPNTNFRIGGTADMNGDGYTDLLFRNTTTGQNAVWLMTATQLNRVVDLPALPNTSYRMEATGDFNRDGQTDIIFRNYSTGQNAVWLMNGTTLAGVVDLPALTNLNYSIEATGDFNRDGSTDIVLRNFATGQNAVWLMNGTSLVGVVDLPALSGSSFRIDGAADFDQDGYVDLLIRNYSTGRNAIWLLTGTTLKAVRDLPVLSNLNYEFSGPR